MPDTLVRGSLRAELRLYPSPLATLADGLQGMLREPHGCFEQTSSTNYPNVMALQYMTSHAGVNPKTIARARISAPLRCAFGSQAACDEPLAPVLQA